MLQASHEKSSPRRVERWKDGVRCSKNVDAVKGGLKLIIVRYTVNGGLV